MVLKCQKLRPFLQIFAVREKSRAVRAIYPSECSHFVLLENGITYYAMTSGLKNISVLN